MAGEPFFEKQTFSQQGINTGVICLVWGLKVTNAVLCLLSDFPPSDGFFGPLTRFLLSDVCRHRRRQDKPMLRGTRRKQFSYQKT